MDELVRFHNHHTLPRLLLGRDKYGHIISVSTNTRRELGNLGIFSPTRGGKSVHLIEQIRRWPYSMIVNDPKGELYDLTADIRRERGAVYRFDPDNPKDRYNPLAGFSTLDEYYDAANFLLYDPNERDKVFTQRAINMLKILFLTTQNQFSDLAEMVSLQLSQQLLDRIAQTSPDLVRQFLQGDKFNTTDLYLTSSWGTLDAKIQPLLKPNVVQSLSGNDFSLSSFLTVPQTLYLAWSDKPAIKPLKRMVWYYLIEELKKRLYHNPQPFLLLIDEAGTTPIPNLQDYIATVNGYGMSMMLAYQDIHQLYELYGENNAMTILNNMDSQIYFYQQDVTTAEYLSRRLGKAVSWSHSTTHHEHGMSEGKQERETSLLTPQEIMQLGDNEIIAFHRNLPPFRLRKFKPRRQLNLVKLS